MNRQTGTAERAKEKLELDRAWPRGFDNKRAPVQEEEYQDDVLPGVETEAIEESGGKVKAFKGSASFVKRGQLKKEEGKIMKATRRYR